MPGRILIITIFLTMLHPCMLPAMPPDANDTGVIVNPVAEQPPVFSEPEDDETFFEGTLHYTLAMNDSRQNFRYRIRRGMVRLEIDDPHMDGTMTVLMSTEEERMVLLIQEIHAFTEIAFEDVADRGETIINQMERVIQTGNIKTIGGIENHEYLITNSDDDDAVIRFWSPLESSRYGLFKFPDFVNRYLSDVLAYDLPEGFFPFAIMYQDGRSSFEINLVSIQEEVLDMSLFAVPANYRKLSITIPGY